LLHGKIELVFVGILEVREMASVAPPGPS